MSDADETEQIRKAACGDRRAQAALVHRHMPGLYAFALRILLSREEAEDVTQETFLRAWKVLPDWQPRAKFSTWLYRVALNLSRDRLRKHRETLMPELPELSDTGLRPDQALEQIQAVGALGAAISALPQRQRAALQLCAIEGRSQQDAAEILEISVDALESLLARARRSLRQTVNEDSDR